jgi:hypothetical protein
MAPNGPRRPPNKPTVDSAILSDVTDRHIRTHGARSRHLELHGLPYNRLGALVAIALTRLEWRVRLHTRADQAEKFLEIRGKMLKDG